MVGFLTIAGFSHLLSLDPPTASLKSGNSVILKFFLWLRLEAKVRKRVLADLGIRRKRTERGSSGAKGSEGKMLLLVEGLIL